MSNSHGNKHKCHCGFKVRGSNHEEGSHHKQMHPKVQAALRSKNKAN
jgi:hypothetical protein